MATIMRWARTGHERTPIAWFPTTPSFWAFFVGAMGALVIFGRLGCPLLEPEESRYAEMPRQMLALDQWITPVWHGQPYYHKPPLLYWLVMISYRAFGVHDWSARLVPCLAAWLTLMAVFFWAWRKTGVGAAKAGGLLLCLSPAFIYRGPLLTMDSLLTLWVVLGLWAGHEALAVRGQGSERGQLKLGCWLLSAASCGLGILTKGPVALALVAVPLMIFAVVLASSLSRRGAVCQTAWSRGPTLRHWLIYLGLAGATAGPWYLAVAWQDPEAAASFFWFHNLQRFLDPFDHAEPMRYYLPHLLIGLLPGSLLLPWMLVRYCRVWLRGLAARAKSPGAKSPGAKSLREEREPAVRSSAPFLAALAAVWCLAFFSLSGCKRPGYILPAFPLLALVLGTFVAETMSSGRRAPLLARWPILNRGMLLAGPALAVLFAWELLAVFWLLPTYHARFGLRQDVCRHRAEGAQPEVTVACYPRGWDSVGFYLHRHDVRVFTAHERDRLRDCLHSGAPILLFVKSAFLSDVWDALPPEHPCLAAKKCPGMSEPAPGKRLAVVFIPASSTRR